MDIEGFFMENLKYLRKAQNSYKVLVLVLSFLGSMTVSANNADTVNQLTEAQRVHNTSIIADFNHDSSRNVFQIHSSESQIQGITTDNNADIDSEQSTKSNKWCVFFRVISVLAFFLSIISLLFSIGIFKLNKKDVSSNKKEQDRESSFPADAPRLKTEPQTWQMPRDEYSQSNVKQQNAAQVEYKPQEKTNDDKKNVSVNVGRHVERNSGKQNIQQTKKEFVQPKEETIYVQPQMIGGLVTMVDCGESSKEYMPFKILVKNGNTKVLFNETALAYVINNIETTISKYAQCQFKSRNTPARIVTLEPGKAYKDNDKWILTDKPILEIS